MRLVKVSKRLPIGWVGVPLALVRLLPAARALEAEARCAPGLRITRLEVSAGRVTVEGERC